MISGRESNMNHFPCIIREKGFTLIEILIAMVILGIAFMGLANLQISCINGNSNSCCLTKAVVLAQDKMEELKNMNPGHPDLADTNPGNNDNLRQSIDSQDSDHREDNVNMKGGSSKTVQDLNYDSYTRIWNVADGTPFSGSKTVVVIVTWEYGRKSVVISSVI